MKVESIAEDLEATGLNKSQASVYIRLLQTGPAKVGRLSTYFDSSRSTLYRILDELAEAGYVSKSLERPTVFTPADPEEMFQLSLEAVERTREQVTHVRERRLEDLRALYGQEGDPQDDRHWRKMEGTDRIYDCLHDMAESAETSIWSASNHEASTARFLPAVEEAWRIVCHRAEAHGVDVRLLFDFEHQDHHEMPDWLSPTETLTFRQIDADETIHFIVFDGEELLMWVRPTPVGTLGEKDDIAVKTNAPGSVVAHRMLFEELWDKGEPVSIRLPPE